MSTLFDLEVDDTPWASHGEIFTRRWVVETLLDLTGYRASNDLGDQLLVEPSAGTGGFLLPAIERLLASTKTHGRGPDTLGGCIQAWEMLAENVAARTVSDALGL